VFLLLGEVRWEFEIDGLLTMGVNLIEGEYSDMERWAETFNTIFVDDSSLK
jgi:hypothetical protein